MKHKMIQITQDDIANSLIFRYHNINFLCFTEFMLLIDLVYEIMSFISISFKIISILYLFRVHV